MSDEDQFYGGDGEMPLHYKVGIGFLIFLFMAFTWYLVFGGDEEVGVLPNVPPPPSITWHTPPEGKTISFARTPATSGTPYDMTCPDGSHVVLVNSHNGAFAKPRIKCSDGTELTYNTAVAPWSSADGRSTESYPDGVQSFKYRYASPGGNWAMTALFGNPPDSKIFTCPTGTKFVGMRGDSGAYIGTAEFGCR